MSPRIFVLSFFAVALMLQSAAAQPSVSTNIILVDTAGNPIAPTAANTYTIPLGTQFSVRVQGTLLNPNFTDSHRAGTALDNVPLGIELMAGDLVTSGINIVSPMSDLSNWDANSSLPHWAGFQELTQTPVIPFVNVLDVDYDGDLDVAGAGVANLSLSLSNPNFLSNYQLGVNGPTNLFEGLYSAASIGNTQLMFDASMIVLYKESTGSSNALSAYISYYKSRFDPIAYGDGYTANPITINVVGEYNLSGIFVPEPSTLLLGSLGTIGLSLVGLRRRKA